MHSPIIKYNEVEDEMGGACSTNGGKKRNVYRLLVGNPEGRRPLGRPRHRWVDNFKIYLGEMGWGGLAQDRDKCSCEFCEEPLGSIKCWETIEWILNW
jgi:hypothetical protein